MTVRPIASFLALFGLLSPSLAADTLTIESSRDNSIYEENGTRSNGAGVFVFAGRSGPGARRGLMRFDLSAIPAGSTINSVTLRLQVNRAGQNAANSDPFSLHRLTADWGEGTSNTGASGSGAAATTGDATWTHRFFDTDTWGTAGGDFVASPSNTTALVTSGSDSFPSSPAMVADVQAWLDDPANNFGWLLRGNESLIRTSRRIVSHEGNNPVTRPRIEASVWPSTMMLAAPYWAASLPISSSTLSTFGS